MRIRMFVCLFVFLTFFSGCETNHEEVVLSGAYVKVRDESRTSFNDYRGPRTIDTTLLDDPIDCKGLAGKANGVGLGLRMSVVELEGETYLYLMTDDEVVDAGDTVQGQKIILSPKVLSRANKFIP